MCAKATPVITWPTPANIVYGTTLGAAQLNATTSVPGTFVYTPAADTLLNAGTHTLSVTFTPTDAANYATATASVSLTRAESDADDHLGDAGRYRLRHRAERDAAERLRRVSTERSSTRRRPAQCSMRARRPCR